VFALPVYDEDDGGPYVDFLDAITAARIRLLNATRHYVLACTELEMTEELEPWITTGISAWIRCTPFDEITEILQWSPAEWDDPDEAPSPGSM